MGAHVVEDLPDFLGGGLDPSLEGQVRGHLACCPECAGILADFVEVYGLLALAPVPEAPRPSVRSRLLASVAGGPASAPESRGRIPGSHESTMRNESSTRGYPGSGEGFPAAEWGRQAPLRRFAGQLCALFDIDEARARDLLDRLDQPGVWEPAPAPGSFHWLIDVRKDRLAFFIRVPVGRELPLHQHHGTEETLVLQGRLVDSAGAVGLPGESMPKEDGSRHTVRSEGDVDLVCAVLVRGRLSVVA